VEGFNRSEVQKLLTAKDAKRKARTAKDAKRKVRRAEINQNAKAEDPLRRDCVFPGFVIARSIPK
jgi:hypothetical protein